MRKNKEAYMNYVCPHCLNMLNKCSCELFPPYSLIWVDRPLQEHIRVLNKKGYTTIGCCEGHFEGACITLYIAFANNYNFNEIPEDFIYNERRRILLYNYPKNICKEEMENIKAKELYTLLEWCKNLPNKRED